MSLQKYRLSTLGEKIYDQELKRQEEEKLKQEVDTKVEVKKGRRLNK